MISENPYHTIETPVAASTPLANQFRLPRFTVQPPPHLQSLPQTQLHSELRTPANNFRQFVQPTTK